MSNKPLGEHFERDFNKMVSDANPNAALIEVHLPELILVRPVPHHSGVALLLESPKLGRTQWGLSIEQARQLADALNGALDSLTSEDSHTSG